MSVFQQKIGSLEAIQKNLTSSREKTDIQDHLKTVQPSQKIQSWPHTGIIKESLEKIDANLYR